MALACPLFGVSVVEEALEFPLPLTLLVQWAFLTFGSVGRAEAAAVVDEL